MVFIQISYFECYEYSRIFRENVALFTSKKKKSSESNLYLWRIKKIVVTSTRVILRKTDFFPFFSFHFSPRNVSDLTYLTEFITVCMKEKQRSNVHVVIYV